MSISHSFPCPRQHSSGERFQVLVIFTAVSYIFFFFGMVSVCLFLFYYSWLSRLYSWGSATSSPCLQQGVRGMIARVTSQNKGSSSATTETHCFLQLWHICGLSMQPQLFCFSDPDWTSETFCLQARRPSSCMVTHNVYSFSTSE